MKTSETSALRNAICSPKSMRMRMFTALMIKWVLHRLMTSANECRKEWTRELALMIKPLLASLRSMRMRMTSILTTKIFRTTSHAHRHLLRLSAGVMNTSDTSATRNAISSPRSMRMRMRMFTALMIKWVLHRLMMSGAKWCRQELTRQKRDGVLHRLASPPVCRNEHESVQCCWVGMVSTNV